MEEFNRQLLTKLTESFEDFKERLIRIEENIKNVKDVKEDVDQLKIQNASLKSKADSAHKRLDTLESNQTWLWRTVGASIIGLIFFIVQAFIKVS